MSAFKGTPGPWEVAEENGDYFVQVASQPSACHPMFDRYRIIHGWVGGDGTDSPNPELGTPIANARLIAAAPELLEALIDCRRVLELLAGATRELAVVDAVIAKATGGTP